MPDTPAEFGATMEKHPFADVREKLMQKITLVVLRHSQTRTPVRTGHLRRSETTRVEPGGLRGWVGTNVVYAPFVHKRVPFFVQGLDDSMTEIQKLLQEAGDDYLAALASTTR